MTARARRSLSAVQIALGLATLTWPRALETVVTPRRATVPDLRIVRVLGARQVVQGTIGLARPSATVASAGAAVDAMHALSLVPMIIFSPRYRASASVSAGLAAAASLAGVLSCTPPWGRRSQPARQASSARRAVRTVALPDD